VTSEYNHIENEDRDTYGKNILNKLNNILYIGKCVAGACECGNEPSGSIKSGEFLD
jgi:hypothetical protein